MIKQWSYSRLSLWEKCPRKAQYKVVMRLPDPAGPQAQRGIDVHAEGQQWVENPERPLPNLYRPFEPKMREIAGAAALTEHQTGFTRGWEETGFFSSDVWCRVVYDVIFAPKKTQVRVYDYKTGKKYEEEHKDQLELYNATALLLFPDARESIAADLYLDIGPKATLERKMTRAQLPAVIKKWESRVAVMESDDTFMARPGDYCKWCAYRKSAGGPCSYG